MGALYEYGMKREELREAFDAAKGKGFRHMLVLREVLDNPLQSEAYTLTSAVHHQAEIVHKLRFMNRHSVLGISVELTGVYDLSADFDYQASFTGENQLARTLSFPVRAELEAYKQEQQPPAALTPVVIPAARPWYKRWLKL